MNTDNMTISGETIDYGPCAFMEAYDPGDGVQLDRPSAGATRTATSPPSRSGTSRGSPRRCCRCCPTIRRRDRAGHRNRHGVSGTVSARICCAASAPSSDSRGTKLTDDIADTTLADDWLSLLHAERVDFTLAWRRLADAAAGNERAAARAVRRAARAGRVAGPMARSRRDRAAHRPRERDAPRQSLRDRAQPSRRGGACRRVRQRRPRAVRIDCSTPCGGRTTNHRTLAPYAEPAPADVTANYKTFCGT